VAISRDLALLCVPANKPSYISTLEVDVSEVLGYKYRDRLTYVEQIVAEIAWETQSYKSSGSL
jgi:hypothetical protein